MTFSDDRPNENPRMKSAIRFLAGIGIGIVFGWVGGLFRKSQMRSEQTAGAHVNSGIKSEGAHPPTETTVMETLPMMEDEPAVDDLSEGRGLSTAAVAAGNDLGSETDASQGPTSPRDELSAVQIAADLEIDEASARQPDFTSQSEGEEALNDVFGLEPPSAEATPSNVSGVQCEAEHELGPQEDAPHQLNLSGPIPVGAPAASNPAVAAAIGEELIGGLKETQAADLSTLIEEAEEPGIHDLPEAESRSPRSVGSACAPSTERRYPAPTTYRPRPPESSEEYASSFAGLLPTEYLKWNRWIVEHIVASARKNSEVYLSITPAILASIVAGAGEVSTSPGEAEAAFTEAVAAAYAAISIQNGRLRLLRTFDSQVAYPIFCTSEIVSVARQVL
jgi:hypothetical protein